MPITDSEIMKFELLIGMRLETERKINQNPQSNLKISQRIEIDAKIARQMNFNLEL